MLATQNDRLRNPDLAALILRVTLGVLFLAHAGLKIVVFTPAGTAQFRADLLRVRSLVRSGRPQQQPIVDDP
ncbi:MAG: hypothetical protein IH820_15745 [Bacteroidetes bacterium]|nr:hypothetical protein [Bacteroidota bacterium]